MTKPNWSDWLLMPDVKVWQACVLSIRLEPESMESEDFNWMNDNGTGPYFTSESFPNREAEKKYKDRLKVLGANLSDRDYFSAGVIAYGKGAGLCSVRLDEFARWATSKAKWLDLPPELAGLVTDKSNGNSAQTEAKAASVTVTEQSIDEEIASWFDGVSYQQLAGMFKEHQDPIQNKDIWKSYANEARNNGLKASKVIRAKFNPYKAGLWWLERKNPTGWTRERLYKTLAKNLPARSKEFETRLTGDDYK